MSAEVVQLPVHDARSVDRVLDNARAADLTDIIVIGYDKDGQLWTDVNLVDGGDLLWMIEIFKAKLLHQSIEGVVERL